MNESQPGPGLFARALFPLSFGLFLLALLLLIPLFIVGGGPGLGPYAGVVALLFFFSLGLFLIPEARLMAACESLFAPPRHLFLGILLGGAGLALGLISGYYLAEGGSPRWQVWGGGGIVAAALILSLFFALLGRAATALWSAAQRPLSALGLVLVLILGLEGLLRFYETLAPEPATSPAGAVAQGEVWDYFTDTPVDWAEQYWREHRAVERAFIWTPYVYWRMRPFQGEHININAEGLRATLPPSRPADLRLHFYGGSTMWGYGARDAHTIPSETVRALEGRGVAAEGINYGEWGYISRQDVTLFGLRLALGDVPDVAVFYWGFNDVNVAYTDGYPGIISSEKDRAAQFEGGQCVLDLSPPVLANASLYQTALGERLLQWRNIPPINPAEGCALGTADWAGVNVALAGQQTREPAALAVYLDHMARQAISLGEAYGVRVLIVWQPVLFLKDPLAWYEQQILAEGRWAELGDYYRQVEAEIRARWADNPHILLWSDFYSGLDPKLILFMDKAHVVEEGNRLVGEGLAAELGPG